MSVPFSSITHFTLLSMMIAPSALRASFLSALSLRFSVIRL